MGRRGWSAAPDGWVQIIRGPRPRKRCGQGQGATCQPFTRSRQLQAVCSEFLRADGASNSMNPDTAREMAQCTVVTFERALEAMGDVQGPAVEVMKTELTKAKSASKQPPLDVEINQCRKYVARGERRVKELDAQRAEECALLTEAQERLERMVNAQSRVPTVVHPQDSGELVTW